MSPHPYVLRPLLPMRRVAVFVQSSLVPFAALAIEMGLRGLKEKTPSESESERACTDDLMTSGPMTSPCTQEKRQ